VETAPAAIAEGLDTHLRRGCTTVLAHDWNAQL
jgi:hypothetical protein